MKRKFLPAIGAAALAAGCLAASACSDDTTTVAPAGTAYVALEQVGNVSEDSFTVKMTPSENALSFEYALGEESDREAFENGTLEGILRRDGGQPFDAGFAGLVPRRTYTVFARAYDMLNTAGTVSSLKVTTFAGGFDVGISYVSDRAAGFTVTNTMDYYKYRYMLGTAADRQAFLDGAAESTEMKAEGEHTVNIFGLEPSREYVLYVTGYDRGDSPTPLYEIPVVTPAENACPGARLDIDQIDVYSGTYSFVPNDLCGQITAIVGTVGQYETMINSEANWKGDIMAMLASWSGIGMAATRMDGTLTVSFQTPELTLENPLEAWVMVHDKQYNPVSISRFTFSTPSFDPNAGAAGVDVKVTSVTAAGAVYTFSPNDATLGTLYETVDADWYDGVRNSDEWHETYLQELLLSTGFWHYTPTVWTYTEQTAEPGKRYYAAACPMNANGPEGWGEPALVEYTTLEQ